ncbi:Leptin Precursor [Collichthys lucidus]|uniref:Leptin n=1 Tax=Collichthys lucidus TaxID=240159 RepID=A0A4U5UFB3_COLLU|nr:Leptin Precursor [Collichthys lucidus]
MDYSLPLLFTLLHLLSVGTAAPLMKSKVKWMAEQLVLKLDRNFQVPPGLTLSPPVDVLGGPASIVMVLEGYNSLISDTLDGVTQVKTEISSLAGYLNQGRQGPCTEQRPKPSVPGPLQELQSRKEFIHTVSIEALMRVKELLNLLLKNLDQLQSC